MRYQFSHPEEKDVFFRYDSELPMWVERHHCGETQRIPLRHKNINAEEFFLCLITTKVVHYEDRFEGFAFLGERKCPISKPADCKWVIHKVLNISKKRPLIQIDRQEKRYLWPLRDEEMLVTEQTRDGDTQSPPQDEQECSTSQEQAGEDGFRVRAASFSNARETVDQEFEAFSQDLSDISSAHDDIRNTIAARAEEFRKRQQEYDQRFRDFSTQVESGSSQEQANELRDKIAGIRKQWGNQ